MAKKQDKGTFDSREEFFVATELGGVRVILEGGFARMDLVIDKQCYTKIYKTNARRHGNTQARREARTFADELKVSGLIKEITAWVDSGSENGSVGNLRRSAILPQRS